MYIADTYSVSSCKTALVLGVHGNPNINGKGIEEDVQKKVSIKGPERESKPLPMKDLPIYEKDPEIYDLICKEKDR